MCVIETKRVPDEIMSLGGGRHTANWDGEPPTIERIVAPYDDSAEQFLAGRREKSGLFNTFVWPAYLKVLGELDGKRILDMGTGPGELAARMRDGGAMVDGVDISGKMLRLAQSTFLSNYEFGLQFIRASATALPLASGKYDLVTAVYIMNHMDNNQLESTLAEGYRALEEGGKMIILDTHPDRNQLYYSQNNGNGKFTEGWYSEKWPESVSYVPTFYRQMKTWKHIVKNSLFKRADLYQPIADKSLAETNPVAYQHYASKRVVIFGLTK